MGNKMFLATLIETEEGEEPILVTQATDDWIRAGRLKVKAEKGDKRAQKKLEEMDAQLQYEED